MTFAALRQAVLQGGALSSALFAEDVTITAPGDGAEPASVRVKIEHDDMVRRRRGGTASGNESSQLTFDTRERIRVTVSRDVNYVGGLAERPAPAATLVRSEARDPNQTPFAFRGEIVFEGDQHAVYVFERPRRIAQGKAT